MAAMDQVNQIRDKIDLVSFIQEVVPLKKTGKNFKGLCPFHNEKTPSFMVSPEKQVWHCFGCNAGGDIYTFLMQYERIDFPEALRILAKRAGIELVQTNYDSGFASKKERLYSINSLAAEYYHYLLTKHAVGEKARSYLKERGLNDRIIETFQLGFAPSIGNGLSRYLLEKKKYEKEELIDAGLAFNRGRDVVDFFRGRIMFPLIDHRDNVVGFSGRILDNTNSTAKYINTRETLVYHKGEHFYGLNVTKEFIRKTGQAILVEGEFDVISSFQEGITNVVGVKGTALTEQQINLIGRYAQKISICFDQDSAGQEAIRRSLPLIESKGLRVTVIVLQDGKDPDEAVRKNPAGFKMAIRKDMGVYDYLFEQARARFDATTIEGKKEIADELLPVISEITNAIIKEHYLRKLSSLLNTSYESIAKELEKKQKRTSILPQIPRVQPKRSREEILEEYLISLILQSGDPQLALEKANAILVDVFPKEKACQKLLDILTNYFQYNEIFDSRKFEQLLPQELHFIYNKSILFPLPSFSSPQKYLHEIEKVSRELRDLSLREKLRILGEQISKYEKEGKSEEVESLRSEYAHLLSLLHK
jgi:DNA primase